MTVILYKIGDIPSTATVTFGTVGQIVADNGGTVGTVTAGSVTITVLPKCSVNASTLNVDFGTFGPREVSASAGPTRSVNFSALCTGPTQPTSITATLAATPDTNDPSMIQNTGAQNLAIRLREPSSNTTLVPNNSNSTIKHTPSGSQMQSDFALEATVLRVGATAPTVGRINATATITLTIN
ncbi:fimbrial protein [Trinickia sp. YCB016]